jgi:Ca2+-binding RTX toxin-like protein
MAFDPFQLSDEEEQALAVAEPRAAPLNAGIAFATALSVEPPDPAPGVAATFTDPTGTYTGQAAAMIANAEAAFARWAQYLGPSAGSIEINFHLVPSYPNRGGGQSVVVAGAVIENGLTVYDQGAAFELRTGIDPNGANPDIDVFFDVNFLTQNYWINPLDGTPVPADKSDLVAVIGHEIGHALAFNGWKDWGTYQLPGNYESTFDSLVSVEGGAPFFVGRQATKLYGGPVPLTQGNLFHVGNQTGAGSELVSGHDIMNGVVMPYGEALQPGLLDIAILSDCGLSTILGDRLNGSASADHMFGGDGNDKMMGLDGNDQLSGDAGKDHLTGGPGNDELYGGTGNDDLGGGAGDDALSGGAGADTLSADKGVDTFVYNAVSESKGTVHDTIADADFRADRFDLNVSVTHIDPLLSAGSLSTATIDTGLATALAGRLTAHGAILFTPDAGDLAGHTLLIVDANGTAGYQAGKDHVFELASPDYLDRLDPGDFV